MNEAFPWRLTEMAAAIAILNQANVRSNRSAAALREAARTLAQPGPSASATLTRLAVEPLDADGRLRSLSDIIAQFERADPSNRDLMLVFGVQPAGALGALIRHGAATLVGLTAQVQQSEDREFLLADTRRILGLT